VRFLDRIIDYLLDIALFFLDFSHEVRDWGNWARWAADFILDVADAFARMAYQFDQFNDWVAYIGDRIDYMLDLDTVLSIFSNWIDYATWAWNWVRNAWYNVRVILDAWWGTVIPTIYALIADIESWTESQLNSFRDEILAIVADVESWTITQLNNLLATFNLLITDVEAWTTTQLNNLSSTFNTLISDVRLWTTAQINNARDFLTILMGDLENWTQAQINTIQATLTTLIDWPALTSWVTTWWSDRVIEVGAWINSAFIERESFWAGWQDIRDKVFEFFDDPEQFLYKMVDRIIERFW